MGRLLVSCKLFSLSISTPVVSLSIETATHTLDTCRRTQRHAGQPSLRVRVLACDLRRARDVLVRLCVCVFVSSLLTMRHNL